MSNEYKDWLEEMKNSPARSKEWNRWFLMKYPWMEPVNLKGQRISEVDKDYDFDCTCADDFPKGWWDTFGLQMCEEIDQALRELPEEQYNNFYIVQIKEKYGELRFYTGWETDKISEIIGKYEDLSRKICIECGKPATHMSLGWISYYCAEHAPKGSVTLEKARATFEQDPFEVVSIYKTKRIKDNETK